MKYTENDKVPQYFKFTIETMFYMSVLVKLENRSNTNLLENLVKSKAVEHNITPTQEDINKFIKELNSKKKNNNKK